MTGTQDRARSIPCTGTRHGLEIRHDVPYNQDIALKQNPRVPPIASALPDTAAGGVPSRRHGAASV